MREKDIERILVTGIRKLGGVAFKFTSPGNDGVPDRLVVMPNGRVCFVELKQEKGRLSGLQKIQIARLQDLGHYVGVLYGAEEVRVFLRQMESGEAWPQMRKGFWI